MGAKEQWIKFTENHKIASMVITTGLIFGIGKGIDKIGETFSKKRIIKKLEDLVLKTGETPTLSIMIEVGGIFEQMFLCDFEKICERFKVNRDHSVVLLYCIYRKKNNNGRPVNEYLIGFDSPKDCVNAYYWLSKHFEINKSYSGERVDLYCGTKRL